MFGLFVHDIYLVAILSRTATTTALVEESNLPDSRMNWTRQGWWCSVLWSSVERHIRVRELSILKYILNNKNSLWFVKTFFQLTVVFSRHFNRWWCCSSKISSSLKSSESNPFCSCRNILLSANFFLLANAAEELAFATRILANRAFRCAFLLSARWFWW